MPSPTNNKTRNAYLNTAQKVSINNNPFLVFGKIVGRSQERLSSQSPPTTIFLLTFSD